jgi:hypothetical protein
MCKIFKFVTNLEMVSQELAGQIPFRENPCGRFQKRLQSPVLARLFARRDFFNREIKMQIGCIYLPMLR